MEQAKVKDDSLRKDGTPKSTGFFGPFKTLDGTNRDMTEFSVGVDFGSGEVEIPSVVPTLTKGELDYLRSGKDPSTAIVEKAKLYARERMAQGKSPFWGEGEEVYNIPQDKKKNLRRTAASQRSERVPVSEQGLGQTLSEKSGAVLKGLVNIPADAARYPLRGLAWAANKTGLLSDVQARMARDSINESADNPVYLSKDYNNFLNAMGDKHPNTALVSEFTGNVLTGTAMAKGVKSLAKNLSGQVDLTKPNKTVMGVKLPISNNRKHWWNKNGATVKGGSSAGAYTTMEEVLPTIGK